MTKMRILLKGILLVSALMSYALPLCAYQAPQYLLYMPKAYGPKRGHTEFGVQGEVNYLDKDAIQQVGGFFNIAFTDRLRYGLEVDNQSRVLHHIHATVFHSQIPDREEHNIALGFNNASWKSTDGLPPKNAVIGLFAVYSLSFNNRDFNFHIGAAGDQYREDAVLTLFGIDKGTPIGRISMEWDGADFNMGIKSPLTKNMNAFLVYTPSATPEPDSAYRLVRLGLTFTDTFFKDVTSAPVAPAAVPSSEATALQPLAPSVLPQEPIPLLERGNKTPAPVIEEEEEFVDEVIEEKPASTLNTAKVEKTPAEKASEVKPAPRASQESPASIQERALTTAAMAHLQKGLEYYYAGKLQASAQQYHMVVSLMPNLPVGYTRLGSIYYRMGDKKNARKYWETSLKLEPDNQEVSNALKLLE